jgi:hypothetical protein
VAGGALAVTAACVRILPQAVVLKAWAVAASKPCTRPSSGDALPQVLQFANGAYDRLGTGSRLACADFVAAVGAMGEIPTGVDRV